MRSPHYQDPDVADSDADRAIESIAQALRARLAAETEPARWNAEPEEVRRSVMKLVLTLVDFLRQLMERQALRRVEEGTLSDDEVERLGLALMRLEETIHDLAAQSGLDPSDLNVDLGPVGKLK
jgi:hypothetical protein